MRPGHTLEVVRLDEKAFRVLYLEGGDTLQVMDESTFDQLELDLDWFEGGETQRSLAKECTFMDDPP